MKGGFGPLDLPHHPFIERHGGARRLKVDKSLGIDLGEALSVPGARKRTAGEGRGHPAVVPAAEGCDQDGAAQRRPFVDPELVLHRRSLARIFHLARALHPVRPAR